MVGLRKHFAYALMALSLILAATPASEGKSAEVDILRILREHKVTVVTTEDPAKLERYWLLLGLNRLPVMSLSEFCAKKNKLPGDGDALFVIDRSKTSQITPEFEQLLPLSTAAVGPREVLTYASKTAKNRDRRYGNGWEILVSGPDEKWLHDELSHLGEILKTRVSETTPTKLHWFTVRKLRIVSTEGRQIAEDWIKPQFERKGQGQVFEWDYVPADAYTPQSDDADLAFFLNAASLGDKLKPVVESLPKDLKNWYESPDSTAEIAARKETAGGQERQREVMAIIAPCSRHLSNAVRTKYTSIETIPESLSRQKLADLSCFGKAAIKVWTGDRFDPDSALLSDLASKLASELQKANMGLEFMSKQHAKLIGYATGGFAQADISKVRQQTGGAGALIVLDLVALDAQTKYVVNPPRCETQRYAQFSEAKPEEPKEPNPEQTILFKGKKYRLVNGNRRNDPHYQEDYKAYQEAKNAYPEKIRRWERNRDQYEERRRSHVMDWMVSLDRAQSVTVTGNLHIYDLRTSSSNAGKEVFACPVYGKEEQRAGYKSERRPVRGEDNQPESMPAPSPESSADGSLISLTFLGTCRSAVGKLVSAAILPSDRPERVAKNTVAPVTGTRPAETTQVVAEGDADASLADAKDRAVASALSNAVQQAIGVYVEQTTIGSNFAVIKNEILAKSEGFATMDEFVSESTKDGILHVKVKATVSNRPLADKLKAMGLTAEWTVGVVVPSTLNGKATSAPDLAAEMAIMQQLRDAGFRVLDEQRREKLMKNEAAQRAITGDAKALAALRREFDVDLLITGKATAEYVDELTEGGITYYRTRGSIQTNAFLTDTGKVLSTATTMGEGIEQTKDLAAVVALNDMGDRVGQKLVEDIMLAPAAAQPFVTVKILNVKSATVASKLEEALRDVPGIKQVKRQRYTGGTLELNAYVRSEYWDLVPGKLASSKTGKSLGLKVTSWSKSSLQARVTKG